MMTLKISGTKSRNSGCLKDVWGWRWDRENCTPPPPFPFSSGPEKWKKGSRNGPSLVFCGHLWRPGAHFLARLGNHPMRQTIFFFLKTLNRKSCVSNASATAFHSILMKKKLYNDFKRNGTGLWENRKILAIDTSKILSSLARTLDRKHRALQLLNYFC